MNFHFMRTAIPCAINIVDDIFRLGPALAAKRAARDEKRATPALLCAFPWERPMYPSEEEGIYLRDVLDMEEFRKRLGNILSKPGKYKCTVHPVEQDTKWLYDGDMERNEANLYVEYSPWKEYDCLYPSNCIQEGAYAGAYHYYNKRHVCTCCGAYSGSTAAPSVDETAATSFVPTEKPEEI